MNQYLEAAKEWFRYAEHDFCAAEHIAKTLLPTPHEIVCYHCQQAAEKYLKGFLVFQGDDPPHIHELAELCKLGKKYKPEFDEILIRCDTLSKYATQPRYPYEMPVDEAMMKLALYNISEVKKFMQKIIPEVFTEPEDTEP
ncbi:hypothetical protein AGMMS4952_19920 [Spirochaetia bacterium]|nr:hypothetical protein AGMMS4952_19920 [Spirochaetia bacterium]